MSNGLTFEILIQISRNFQGRRRNSWKVCLQNFMEIDLELTEKSAKNTQRWWKLTATIGYSLSDGGGWSKMKVSFSVSSQSILNRFSWNFVNPIFQWFGINPENFIKKYYIVQKLDHLTCSKCLFMMLLYNPLTSFRFILRIALHVKWSNFWNTRWNLAKFSGLLPND